MAAPMEWGSKTYLMGIVNVTPDSFSGDGLAAEGRSMDDVVAMALAQARAFAAAGAEIIDVGAESTRPRGAYGEHPDIDAETEAALAIPVVGEIATDLNARAMVSIDTSKGSVAAAALEAGATIVNDVWAARRDPGTADAAAQHDAHLVLMHNQEGAEYPDGVFDTVVRELRASIEHAIGRGVGSF